MVWSSLSMSFELYEWKAKKSGNGWNKWDHNKHKREKERIKSERVRKGKVGVVGCRVERKKEALWSYEKWKRLFLFPHTVWGRSEAILLFLLCGICHFSEQKYIRIEKCSFWGKIWSTSPFLHYSLYWIRPRSSTTSMNVGNSWVIAIARHSYKFSIHATFNQ